MNSLFRILIVCIVIVAMSCSRNQDKDVARVIEWQSEISENWNGLIPNMDIKYPKAVIVDSLLIKVLTLSDGKWLHLYDKKSGELVKNVINRGEEYGDIENGSSMTLCYGNSNMSIFDIETRVLKIFNDSYRQIGECAPEIPMFINGIWSLKGNKVLILSPVIKDGKWDKRNAYCIYDCDKQEIIYTYEEDDTSYAYFYDKYISVAPSKQYFAVNSSPGRILELYKIVDNRRIIRIFYGDYEDVGRNGADEPVFSFGRATCTDKYIYVTFADETTYGKTSNIGIWSWAGEPVMKIRTNEAVSMVATSDDNMLYKVSYSDDNGYFVNCIDLKGRLSH